MKLPQEAGHTVRFGGDSVEILAEKLELALAAQLRAIHQLTAALHRAESAEAFYDSALDTIVNTLSGRPGVPAAVRPGRGHAVQGLAPLSSDYRAAVQGHSPWAPSDTDAAAIVVPDVEADPDLQ